MKRGPLQGVDLAALPESMRAVAEQVALHEAGHAVVAVVSGFELGAVQIEIAEGRAHDLLTIRWIPSGETECSAGNVRPGGGYSEDQCRAAAAVAMAGREARRLVFPDDDQAWRSFETQDQAKALGHLGVEAVESADLMSWHLHPELKRQAVLHDQQMLAPVAEIARRLMMDDTNWKAVQNVAALLVRSLRPVAERDGGPGLVYGCEVTPDDTLEAIHSAGVAREG